MHQESQEKRIKELLNKYANFIHQNIEEKTKIIRLCMILAYLENIQTQKITIEDAIDNLIKFLDKLIKPYVSNK